MNNQTNKRIEKSSKQIFKKNENANSRTHRMEKKQSNVCSSRSLSISRFYSKYFQALFPFIFMSFLFLFTLLEKLSFFFFAKWTEHINTCNNHKQKKENRKKKQKSCHDIFFELFISFWSRKREQENEILYISQQSNW